MSEFDFEGEKDRLYVHASMDNIDAALRRAYAAGEESGYVKAREFESNDLDRLVKLAQADPDWRRDDRPFLAEHAANIAENCVIMLSALKAQAVKT